MPKYEVVRCQKLEHYSSRPIFLFSLRDVEVCDFNRDVRSGEAGEALPHQWNCAKENENKVYN